MKGYITATALIIESHISQNRILELKAFLASKGLSTKGTNKRPQYNKKSAWALMPEFIEGLKAKSTQPTRVGKPRKAGKRKAQLDLPLPVPIEQKVTAHPLAIHSLFVRLSAIESKIDKLMAAWGL